MAFALCNRLLKNLACFEKIVFVILKKMMWNEKNAANKSGRFRMRAMRMKTLDRTHAMLYHNRLGFVPQSFCAAEKCGGACRALFAKEADCHGENDRRGELG